MSRGQAPGAAQEKARRVLLHLGGGGDLRALLWALALLVGLGWFTDSLFEWLADLGVALRGGSVDDWLPPHRVIAVGLFLFLLAWVAALAAGARSRYRPRVGTDDAPAQVKGLILFLSKLNRDPATLEASLPRIDGIAAFRDSAGDSNWRMPMEAIAYHLPRLIEVVLICSRPGSAEELALFRRLVARVFPAAELRLHDAADCCPELGERLCFDDVDAVSRVTDDSFQWLLQHGLSLADILIDVTGGQKPNAVAATAVALAEGRRIQYVTGDARKEIPYRVITYDVTYDQ